MGAGELGFDRESLRQVTKGLKSAIDELEEFGSRTGSVMGSGVEELTLSKMEAGDGALADDFEDFCDRWEWGVRALVQNANGLAERLNLSAGRVFEEDQYQAETWKVGFNSIAGNPHASEEDVTGAKTGYGDIARQQFRPDMSAHEANEQMGQEWKDTAHESVTEGQGGFVADLNAKAVGADGDQVDQAVDDYFGPTAEEQAQQQEQQQEQHVGQQEQQGRQGGQGRQSGGGEG